MRFQRFAAVGLAIVAGCSRYGHLPQPQTREEKLRACGELAVGWRERTLPLLREKAQHDLAPAEYRTAVCTLGEPYRARTYKGLLNYGHFVYGWAIPMQITWTEPTGKPRVWNDTFILNGADRSFFLASPAGAAVFVEKVE